MTEPAICAEQLGHRYRGGPWLFRTLDLNVPRGSTLAILAPNGRGKSTLLSVLAGAISPKEGTVRQTGVVAFVPSRLVTELDFTAFDIVLTGRARHVGLFAIPSEQDEAVAAAALDQFGLRPFADRSFQSLSNGEQQLVLLARATASEATIFLFDEPTASLDLHHQRDIVQHIGRLTAGGATVIYTTHDPNHGLLANRALLLFAGNEHVIGEPSRVIESASLERLFGSPIATLTGARGEQRFVADLT